MKIKRITLQVELPLKEAKDKGITTEHFEMLAQGFLTERGVTLHQEPAWAEISPNTQIGRRE